MIVVSKKSVSIGQNLAVLREKAGLSQAEMAKKMSIQVSTSSPQISRIETGEKEVTVDELDAYLNVIHEHLGDETVGDFREFLNQTWVHIEHPPFSHQDRSVLWEAEQTLVSIQELQDDPEKELNNLFRKQLNLYRNQLLELVENVHSREHQIAMVGEIGVGKSTCICEMTGLVIKDEDGKPQPVLEVGGGGITVCEVQIAEGPEYGVIVQPRSDEEVKSDVSDLCNYLINKVSGVSGGNDDESDSLGLSKETVRALRNMAGLTVKREKGEDGKIKRVDQAKVLAEELDDPKELFVEFLSRMKLPRRDRRELFYEKTSGKEPLHWLKDLFTEINNGRHPEFSLPKRIEVVVPNPVLQPDKKSVSQAGLRLRIVDTKGIDQAAERSDIECHFDDPRTSVLLCSGFNSAPAETTQTLMQRANAKRTANLAAKASLLVFPKNDEALAMKDDEGYGVETDLEGYELKQEQIDIRLSSIGLTNLGTLFFNAMKDDVAVFRANVLNRVIQLREIYKGQIQQRCRAIQTLIENHEVEGYQLMIREAARRLKIWMEKYSTLAIGETRAHTRLLAAISNMRYASTILATIRRRGRWPNLDYYHHLGSGTRELAAERIGKPVDDFRVHANNILEDVELSDAHDFVEQLISVLDTMSDKFLQHMQLTGRATFTQKLDMAPVLWNDCDSEWEAGPGFRDRVTVHNDGWFGADEVAEQHNFIEQQITQGWTEILAELSELLDSETQE
jgi:transcriptional regulator with XRE-family HTH domain